MHACIKRQLFSLCVCVCVCVRVRGCAYTSPSVRIQANDTLPAALFAVYSTIRRIQPYMCVYRPKTHYQQHYSPNSVYAVVKEAPLE